MTSFEYVMVLVSIIVALAIAHLLTAVAAQLLYLFQELGVLGSW